MEIKSVIENGIEYEVSVSSIGDKYWYLDGQRHREDGPAAEWSDGTKRWFLNGELHREDGPAIEWSNGTKFWLLNGKLHREGGPAAEYSNGNKYWYLNGKLHREDGPAAEYSNGSKVWYLNSMSQDIYHPNFGCYEPSSREEAIERLNRKPRPYSYYLYMNDINKMFPKG